MLTTESDGEEQYLIELGSLILHALTCLTKSVYVLQHDVLTHPKRNYGFLITGETTNIQPTHSTNSSTSTCIFVASTVYHSGLDSGSTPVLNLAVCEIHCTYDRKGKRERDGGT